MSSGEFPIKSMDWREQLLYAIAYRITEQKRVEPRIARGWVRDVVRKGGNSEHFADVAGAVQEMFTPVIGVVMPFLPHVMSVLFNVVQTENARGWETEFGRAS